jgi:hypothetical protein
VSSVAEQRQDSLSDQMRDVMRHAVESGCYDAHDWLVKAWGSRHGICAHEPPLAGDDTRNLWCVLTAGHDGAHESDGPNPAWWVERDTAPSEDQP